MINEQKNSKKLNHVLNFGYIYGSRLHNYTRFINSLITEAGPKRFLITYVKWMVSTQRWGTINSSAQLSICKTDPCVKLTGNAVGYCTH